MKEKLKQISEYEWLLEKENDMKVPAVVFASKKLMEAVEEDALIQLRNVATLQGIQKRAIAMPDIHLSLIHI